MDAPSSRGKRKDILGLLEVRIMRGVNLAARDSVKRICLRHKCSDPYVVVKMDTQKLKTRVISNNINPEWNENRTLIVTDPNASVSLRVYDHNFFFYNAKMGDAYFSMSDITEAVRSADVTGLPNGTEIRRIQPNGDNCLTAESRIYYNNGKIIQDMTLGLRNVECGEVEIQLQWKDIRGSKGLRS